MKKVCATIVIPTLLIGALAFAGPEAQETSTDWTEHEVRLAWTLPVRAGREEEALDWLLRAKAYLFVNHREDFVRWGVWRNALKQRPHPRLGDHTLEWGRLWLGFESLMRGREFIATLRAEEGWLALEDELDEWFVSEETELASLYPLVHDPERALESASITVQRTARTVFGNRERALELARKQAAYVNAHFPEVAVQVWIESFEGFGKVHWYTSCRMPGDWRDLVVALAKDPEWAALCEGAAELFGEDATETVVVIM